MGYWIGEMRLLDPTSRVVQALICMSAPGLFCTKRDWRDGFRNAETYVYMTRGLDDTQYVGMVMTELSIHAINSA